jgi:hypothetical protein
MEQEFDLLTAAEVQPMQKLIDIWTSTHTNFNAWGVKSASSTAQRETTAALLNVPNQGGQSFGTHSQPSQGYETQNLTPQGYSLQPAPQQSFGAQPQPTQGYLSQPSSNQGMASHDLQNHPMGGTTPPPPMSQ